MEAAAKEKLELTKQRNEEVEWATHVLNKLQTTYQKKVVDYESQAQAVVVIIIRLRQEKQEAHAQAQLGVDRIRHIMSAWRDQAQTSINECSEKVWKEWLQQAAQLQTQLQLEKYEQDRQQQEAEGRTTPITISDEVRPTGETTKDTEEP